LERKELEQKSVQLQLLRQETLSLPTRKSTITEKTQSEFLKKVSRSLTCLDVALVSMALFVSQLKLRQERLMFAPMEALTQKSQQFALKQYF
jgi:hypothetical protein